MQFKSDKAVNRRIELRTLGGPTETKTSLARPSIQRSAEESGMAFMAVLVILVVLSGSSASYLWFMNQSQTRAGLRYRSSAAMAVAEAGVHYALSILETGSDGQSLVHAWRNSYTKLVRVGSLEGRLTLTLDDVDGSTFLISSVGRIDTIERHLRARILLASPALLAGLHFRGFVWLENPPAALFIMPYAENMGNGPWTHIAAGQGIGFASANASLNDPPVAPLMAAGPIGALVRDNNLALHGHPGPVRIMLSPGAELTLGPGNRRMDADELRTLGVDVERLARTPEMFRGYPEVERAYYMRLAKGNTRNSDLNEAVGRLFGDSNLTSKPDSFYSPTQLERVLEYRVGQQIPELRGVVYVAGDMGLLDGQRLRLVDGALIIEGIMQIGESASLEIIHTAVSRMLPGLIVLGGDGLAVDVDARLRVHGLVYAPLLDIGAGAYLDVVGSVLISGHASDSSNIAGAVAVRYDAAVLGTPALQLPKGVPPIAWVAAWEELR